MVRPELANKMAGLQKQGLDLDGVIVQLSSQGWNLADIRDTYKYTSTVNYKKSKIIRRGHGYKALIAFMSLAFILLVGAIMVFIYLYYYDPKFKTDISKPGSFDYKLNTTINQAKELIQQKKENNDLMQELTQ